MPDLLSTVYRLHEQPGTMSIFDRLAAAFLESADYSAARIGSASDGSELYLCFLTSLCSSQKLDYLLGADDGSELSARLVRYAGTGLNEGDYERCEQAVCSGFAILCKRSSTTGIVLNLSENQYRGVGSPVTENVLQGPMNAFTENLDVNTALIRQQIHSPNLKMWETTIGTAARVRVALFHYAGAIDDNLLATLKKQLAGISAPSIQDSGQLLRLLTAKKKMNLFPLAVSSERPDRISADLIKGKGVLIVDGSPFALSLPAVYTDFWHSPEDQYVNPYVSYFLLGLRFLAMFFNLFLPALYVALTSVNVDVNRLEISLAAAASREGVPYPVYIETLLMLIVIDFITEAGIRLPKTISSTVTMVGGVVLGQAIIQANIVSNLLVIIVAATAITNFIVIDYQMGLVQRVLKYFFVVGATIAGVLGIVFCFACLVMYLGCLESFGAPYLTSLWAKDRKNA